VSLATGRHIAGDAPATASSSVSFKGNIDGGVASPRRTAAATTDPQFGFEHLELILV